jgi:hypothetical protein
MLFSYPKVWNACLLILRERGYRLYILRDSDEIDSTTACTWCAEKDGMKFKADKPIELLGLVAIREHHGQSRDTPYWWRIEGPNLMAELEEAWISKLCSLPETDNEPGAQ